MREWYVVFITEGAACATAATLQVSSVIMSNRVGLRLSTQSRFVFICACVVTRVEGWGLCSYTWPLSGSGDIVLL
jgi:hypothetical protein